MASAESYSVRLLIPVAHITIAVPLVYELVDHTRALFAVGAVMDGSTLCRCHRKGAQGYGRVDRMLLQT
jgi:hypothetical protein